MHPHNDHLGNYRTFTDRRRNPKDSDKSVCAHIASSANDKLAANILARVCFASHYLNAAAQLSPIRVHTQTHTHNLFRRVYKDIHSFIYICNSKMYRIYTPNSLLAYFGEMRVILKRIYDFGHSSHNNNNNRFKYTDLGYNNII